MEISTLQQPHHGGKWIWVYQQDTRMTSQRPQAWKGDAWKQASPTRSTQQTGQQTTGGGSGSSGLQDNYHKCG
eukprot:9790969-Karenia_brevis.AAC.1